MANDDFTVKPNYVEVNSNLFIPAEPEEHLSSLLDNAFGLADMLFTLSANGELHQFLPNTLTSSLCALCYLIEQAKNVDLNYSLNVKAKVNHE